MKSTSLENLLDLTLPLGGTLILRNEVGTGEYKGKVYTYKKSSSWCTIFPKGSKNSETAEHIHLRKNLFTFATLYRPLNRTPQLTFWKSIEDSRLFLEEDDQKKPLFSYIFPSFYTWEPKQTPLLENHAIFEKWQNKNGESFALS